MTPRKAKSAKVLVVDDDDALAEMLTIVLSGEGFDTEVCRDGARVIDAVKGFNPDVILLDRMLPNTDGIEVCTEIRKTSNVPIIMLTAMASSADIVDGLDAGADDYITKPFRNSELIARIRARLRSTTSVPKRIEFGRIILDGNSHTVSNAGNPVALTPLEFDLLECLIAEPDRVFTRDELLREVWGYQYPGDTKLVTVHMTRLRQKIEDDADDPQVIRTVRGIGYQAMTPHANVD